MNTQIKLKNLEGTEVLIMKNLDSLTITTQDAKLVYMYITSMFAITKLVDFIGNTSIEIIDDNKIKIHNSKISSSELEKIVKLELISKYSFKVLDEND